MESATNNSASRTVCGKKRSAAQRAADLAFIESYVVRGKTQVEIATLLAAERPYRISRQIVGLDIDRLKKRWIAAALESFGLAQARALRKLEEVEREAWRLQERTKLTGNGDGLKKVLEVHDRVSRLLGLDAPKRMEMSGPNGKPIELGPRDVSNFSDDEKDEVLARHYEGIQREARREGR
jgi:hypothetical protein